MLAVARKKRFVFWMRFSLMSFAHVTAQQVVTQSTWLLKPLRLLLNSFEGGEFCDFAAFIVFKF
jgi:hypothetical protein